jgi:alkylation response protein AidB-like acyl-CoA dehydrogenase
MTFTLNDDARMLKETARDFFREQAPVSRLRRLRDEKKNGRDPELWAEMSALGFAGVIVPEEFGGAGLGYVALGAVLEEAGRTLVASPLHSCVGACALMLAGTEAQKQQWLPKIASGEVIATIAADEGAHHDPRKSKLKFANMEITGAKKYVADGHIADLFIVTGENALFLVHAIAKDGRLDGLSVRELVTADSRGAADLTFDGVIAEPMNGGSDVIDAILDHARIGLAAEMLGQASEAFEITSEYLKTRRQFGQVIGGFQALQHRAAKLFTELELTRSCVMAALDAVDRGSEDIAEYASLAKARAAETLHLATNEMVQLHGGIGMTDEHDAGLYLKRARVAEALYGSASFHRDRYAAILGF